jgi:predicted ester cyclase
MNKRTNVRFLACLICALCVQSDAATVAQSHEDDTEQNKKVVRLYIDGLWNELRYDLIEQVLAPGVVAHAADGTQELGRERFRQVIPTIRNAFPDLHLAIDEIVAEGDRVAVLVRA